MLISVAFLVEGFLLLVVGLLLVFGARPRLAARRAAGSSKTEPDVVVVGARADRERLAASQPAVTLVDITFRFAAPPRRRGPSRLVEVTRWTATVPSGATGGSLVGFLTRYTASRVVGTEWPVATERWSVSDPAGLDGVAASLDDLRRLLHRALVGEPISGAARALGLHEAAANEVGALTAAAAALPGDSRLRTAATVIRVTGVVIGLATGHPVLAIACVKSLAKRAVVRFLTRPIRRILSPSTRPSARPTRPPARTEPRDNAQPRVPGTAPRPNPSHDQPPPSPVIRPPVRDAADPIGNTQPPASEPDARPPLARPYVAQPAPGAPNPRPRPWPHPAEPDPAEAPRPPEAAEVDSSKINPPSRGVAAPRPRIGR